MNLYFLVEGRRTERKVYPMWLSVLRPDITKVDYAADANANNYYLISGEGYPSLLNHLENAIKEVNTLNCYDYLILCLDAEETTIEERKNEVLQHLQSKKIELTKAKLIILVQNPCFETWFLGNRKIFKRTPQSELLNEYINFYDVRQKDPEEMPCHKENTRAQFHHAYLCEIFKERNITYSKQKPGNVGEATFLSELINRNTETGHISSFSEFINFIQKEVMHS
ncbi:hypothetical protein [Bacteroides sp.]